jgi:hypothetical protein
LKGTGIKLDKAMPNKMIIFLLKLVPSTNRTEIERIRPLKISSWILVAPYKISPNTIPRSVTTDWESKENSLSPVLGASADIMSDCVARGSTGLRWISMIFDKRFPTNTVTSQKLKTHNIFK